MARPRSATGSIDDLGHLITAAFGLDRTWDVDAACHKDRFPRGSKLIPSPWQFDPNQKVTFRNSDGEMTIIKGREMIQAALMICHNCPVQYECATYAVEGEVLAGTWAMRIFDLAWLRKQSNWRAIIARAKRRAVPLQHYVPALREGFDEDEVVSLVSLRKLAVAR